MKKGLVFLFAALLVVGLPLSAIAKTLVYHYKNEPIVEWCQDYTLDDFFPGPAAEFGKPVTVCYVGERSETVRVKDNIDVGWNLVMHGTASIYDATTGGGTFVAATAFRALYKPASTPTGELLYSGPFQVEEVAQDDGGDANCLLSPPTDNRAMFGIRGGIYGTEYGCADPGLVDYLMHHWKITGNKIFFFKAIMKNGNLCYEDTRGLATCAE
jgi:hypothetical protein